MFFFSRNFPKSAQQNANQLPYDYTLKKGKSSRNILCIKLYTE